MKGAFHYNRFNLWITKYYIFSLKIIVLPPRKSCYILNSSGTFELNFFQSIKTETQCLISPLIRNFSNTKNIFLKETNLEGKSKAYRNWYTLYIYFFYFRKNTFFSVSLQVNSKVQYSVVCRNKHKRLKKDKVMSVKICAQSFLYNNIVCKDFEKVVINPLILETSSHNF